MGKEWAFSLSALSVAAGTALIPLVARAHARTLFPDLGFVDEQAERTAAALGVPLDAFGTDLGWLRGAVFRAKWFDNRCRRFFAANPNGLGVALGAGLNTRFQRLNQPNISWVDIDLPEVIALKQRFVKATNRYRMLAGDVTDLAWIDRIGWQPGTPIMLTAEGLLMYLAPSDVGTVFRGVAARFSSGDAPAAFLFDYASPPLVLSSRFHPALRHTNARFAWGLAGARMIRHLDARYQVIEDQDISPECGYPATVFSLAYQFMTMGRPFYGLANIELKKNEPGPPLGISPECGADAPGAQASQW